jgi:hypothetical protein
MPDPTVSDGATFEEMVDELVPRVARAFFESKLWFVWCGPEPLHILNRQRQSARIEAARIAVHEVLATHQADRALIEEQDAEIGRLRMEMAELIVNASPATVYELQAERDALTNERQRQEDRWAIVAGRITEIRRLLRTTSTGYLIVDDNQWANLLFDAGLEDREAWREARDGALSEPAVEAEQRCAHGKTVSQECRLCTYDELLPDPEPSVEASPERCPSTHLDPSTPSGVTRCMEDAGHGAAHRHQNADRTITWSVHVAEQRPEPF